VFVSKGQAPASAGLKNEVQETLTLSGASRTGDYSAVQKVMVGCDMKSRRRKRVQIEEFTALCDASHRNVFPQNFRFLFRTAIRANRGDDERLFILSDVLRQFVAGSMPRINRFAQEVRYFLHHPRVRIRAMAVEPAAFLRDLTRTELDLIRRGLRSNRLMMRINCRNALAYYKLRMQ
jgi:hypothetical protein